MRKLILLNKIVAGADEAGRGLIIGPMTIGAVASNDEINNLFKRSGIKDSKKYSSLRKLQEHANFIRKSALSFSIKTLDADVLTNFNKNNMTMDEAEAFGFFRAVEEITEKVGQIEEYQVDNFQAISLLRKLLKENRKTENVKLIVLPKAEEKYVAVSAGSILAREKSLIELEKIRRKYGNFGSGSTNDKQTINWLKNYYQKNGSWPNKIVRTFWKTTKKIEDEFNKERK